MEAARVGEGVVRPFEVYVMGYFQSLATPDG
jgi:hypothetical protein